MTGAGAGRIAAPATAEIMDERETPRVDALGIKAPPAFAVSEASAAGGPTIIVLRGELDMAAATAVRRLVDRADRTGLVIDLSAVAFADSSALRELLHARTAVAERGARLVLAAVPQPVRRLLEMTGTTGLFEVASSSEEAVERLGAGS
jgi:anti-anti-sigma factor